MSASIPGINNATRTNTFRPQYDPASQLTTLQLGYGATRKMGYDSRGYLTTMIDSGSSGAISTIVDTYDSAGRKTKQVRDGVTSTYTMDNDDRLTLENRGGNLSTFAYDQDRNLTLLHNHGQNAVTMSHNALGQVVTSIAGSVVTTNIWDNAGRKTLANAGGTLTTFGWDQENRMVSRARNAEYDAFVYDEANHLRYRHDPTSETPDSLSYNYLDDNTFTVYSGQFGTRSEQMTPLEGVNVGNDDLDFLLDPLGSVIGKTSSSGVEDLSAFFPYGEFRIGMRPVSDLWAFVGSLGYRRFDDTLYDVWNRWLETNAGHWKSLDALWPSELAYMYVAGMSQMLTDGDGLMPPQAKKKRIDPWLVHRRFESRLQDCGLRAAEAHTLALVFECIAHAESSFDPEITAKGTNGTAYGLFQLGTFQWKTMGCMPKGCDGKILDPYCNMEAALNLFVSMCNDNPNFEPVKAFRGYWGCTRSEGKQFYPCLARIGISSFEDIRKLPCPKKSAKCPGCKKAFSGIRGR